MTDLIARKKHEDHPPYVTVTEGMSGFFAVMMSWCSDYGGFYEPWNTGVGRYPDREDAEREAKSWAESEEMEYRP